MSSPVHLVLKHAFVGSVVGEATAVVAQEACVAITNAVASSLPNGPLGNAVARGVINGVVSSVIILGGDQVLSMVVANDDPLFRMFFYQIVFNRSPAMGLANATRSLLTFALRSSGPSYSPGPAMSKKCGDCSKSGKSCDGCGGH
jgi:hypothetical protein